MQGYEFSRLKLNYMLDTNYVRSDTFGPYALDYCFFNPNPRGCHTGDCVKRAIVVATGMDYKALELMMNRNKLVKDAYNAQKNYEHVIDLLGGKVIKMRIPAGKKKWHVNTIGKVMNRYDGINYVLQVSKHLIGVREACIFDTGDDRYRDKGIYKMFVFGATTEQVYQIQKACDLGDDDL